MTMWQDHVLHVRQEIKVMSTITHYQSAKFVKNNNSYF